MKDTTLATFRVDKDTWKDFKQWASERGSNASTELNQFILRSLGRIDNNLDTNIDSPDNRIDEELDQRIDKYLDNNLDERIEATVQRYLDKHIDKYIDSERETNLDTNIDSSLDINKSIDSNIDTSIDKDPTTKDQEKVIEPLANEKGLSGKELASLLGVRSEYLTRWKSGRNIPKEDSENYEAYQNFCNYRWEKKKGNNQAKYYRVVDSEN